MFGTLLSRYFASPDLTILPVRYDHMEEAREKPSVALSSIPYTSVETRYEIEGKMLEAVRRGDISEALYQQNLFMGFTIDQRNDDPLRLLSTTTLSMQEIAERCGFSDANYYTRVFKKIHGTTPNEYKSLQRPEQSK